MNAGKNNKFRSVRFWLPALLLALTVCSGILLYLFAARVHEAEFEATFNSDEIFRATYVQEEIERWIQRNDMDMVQSTLGELAARPELKAALFLDATNIILAADRRELIGRPFKFDYLGFSQLDPKKLMDAIIAARQTMRGEAFFTKDRNGLITCFPTSLPLRPGDLEARRGGLILMSYDFHLQKAAGIKRIQSQFFSSFAAIAVIALTLGITLHYLVTRRLEQLKEGMAEFAVGESFHPITSKLGDEFSDLFERFNEMAATILREIKERKNAEETVRKSAEEIQDLYNHAPCGYQSLDKDGIFVQINDTELQWLGYTREEVVGKKKFSDFITGPSLQLFEEQFPKFKERGWMKDLEYEMIHKDGSIRSMLISATAVRDQAGNYLMSRGTMYDITERKRAEQNVALLSFALNNVHEAAFLIDEKSRFHFVNEEACRFLGYTCEELTGLGVPDVDPDFPMNRWADYWEKLRTGRSLNFEGRHRTKDGRIFPVEVNANYFEYGGKSYSLALVRDITERKRAEEALRQANLYNRTLIEVSLDPLVTIGMDGKITDVNTATETATGYSRAELLGTDFSDYFTDPEKARTGYQQVFREGLVKDYALELRHRDGHLTSVLYNASVYRNEKGEVTGVLAAARDVTERKRAEAALEESEKSFRTLAESVPQIVWATRADGWNIYFNQRWVDYTGMTFEESYGHGWNTPFHPEDQKRAWEAWQQATQRGSIYSLEARLRRADGVYRWWLVRGVPQRDATGKIIKWFGTCTDIHDLKVAEEQILKLNTELEQRVQERTRELAASEQRFRIIYDTAPVSIWQEDWTEVIAAIDDLRKQGVTDFAAHFHKHPEFVTRALNAVKILDVNQWTLGMFAAQNKGEMLASLGTVFATPETLPGFVNELLALSQGQAVYRTEMTLNTVKGELIHGLIAMSFPPRGSGSGNVLVSVIDITERKAADESLRKSEERMRLFFEHELVGTAITSPEKGWLEVNSKLCEMLGYSREELTHLTWADLTYPEDLAPDETQFERLLHGEIEGYTLEKRFVRKDGGIVFTNLAVGCVRRPDRSVDYVLALLEDITDRKRAEMALRESQRSLEEERYLLHTLANNIPDALYFKDVQSRFVRINQAQARRFGLSDPAQAVGKTDFDFFTEEHARPAFEDEQAIIRSGRPIVGKEEKETWPDGRTGWVMSTKMPLLDQNGRVVGTFGISSDITERKRAEESIRILNEELQQRAAQLETTNKELQRMNKLFIGRELRMVELKEKIRALEKTDANTGDNQTKGTL